MNKKQKKNLYRIIITFIMIILLGFLNIEEGSLLGLLYLVPYFLIGYDILKGA